MTSTIAVTGATGFIGGAVARALFDAGLTQRVLVRTPSKAPVLPGADVQVAGYGDAEAARRALDGIETLFMVSATESADRLQQHLAFVAAAAGAGVRHIVYTSFQGAAPDAVFTLARDHAATEDAIRDSGMHFTFLRDSLYIDFLSGLVGEDGAIRGPAGNGRVAAVTRADVARTASAVLLEPDAHRDATYTLTGPESLTMTEIAAAISGATGRAATFHEETVEEAYESRKKWPAPAWQYDAWVSTYTAIKAGELATVTDDVENVTGTRPTSLGEFLRA